MMTNRLKDLQTLNEFRESNIWCNADLVSSDNVKFPIHTPVAMITSGYFWAAFQFTDGEEDNSKGRAKIIVPGVTSSILAPILKYMYLGEIYLDKSNLWYILRASDFLQMNRLTEHCLKYLRENMCSVTCSNLLDMTQEKLYLPRVNEVAREYALSKICEPRLGADERRALIHALDVNVLLSLLDSDVLNAPNEELVWETIVSWLVVDYNKRVQHLPLLMNALRISLLPTLFVINTILCHPLIVSNAKVSNMVNAREQKVREWLQNPQPDKITRDLTVRYPHEILITFGGWNLIGPTNYVYAYDVTSDQWFAIKELQLPIRSAYQSVVRIDNHIYLVGGTEVFPGSQYYDTSKCHRLDLNTLKWEQISSLESSRNFVNCVALDGRIYAVGGRSDTIRRLKSAEVYDVSTGVWSFIPDMKTTRSDAGIAVLDNKIYVVGGYTGQYALSTAECYDPVFGTWEEIPNMNIARSGHKCVAINGCLFVIGGFTGESRLTSCELYDPVTRQWQLKAPMHVARSNMAAVVIRHTVLVIGGYNGYNVDNAVELYDSSRNEWFRRSYLPHCMSALSGIVIEDCPGLVSRILEPRRDLLTLAMHQRQVHRPMYTESPDLTVTFETDQPIPLNDLNLAVNEETVWSQANEILLNENQH